MRTKKLICDHCKQSILKDGVHVTFSDIDVRNEISDFEPFAVELFLHKKCVIAATELYIVKEKLCDK
jgi:hypothetical protein